MLRALDKLIDDLRADAARYESLGGWKRAAGFWAGATYRLGRFAPPLPTPARLAAMTSYRLLSAAFRNLYHVQISPDADIGPGLCLIHPWNILVGPSKIGDNCLIFHDVTLGTNARTPNGFPTIGDNVDIYVGARVLGPVSIGDDAKVGANCVVLDNVPSGATVVPAANRVVPAAMVAAFGPRHEPRPAVNGKRL